MKRFLRPFLITTLSLFLLNLTSCEKPQSFLKIFVKDQSGNKSINAQVKIISSTTSNPATSKHSDIGFTNSEGYCTFNLDTFFEAQIATSRDGYFDVVAEKDQFTATGSVRATYQTTQVLVINYISN